MPSPEADLEDLAARIRKSRHLLVFTGAGVSRESGLPTFREAQSGWWARYDPMKLASAEGFLADPALVWSWYRWRKALARAAEPNAAHHVIAWLEKRVPRFTLVTQNVDGLHARAGSRAAIELHGSLERVRCCDCGAVFPWETAASEEAVPRCPSCSGRLRPDVVWFGEALPEAALTAALAVAEACDLCLAVGTSALVYPAAWVPQMACAAGAALVEINPEPTALRSLAALSIARPAGEAFAKLKALLDDVSG